MAKVVKLSRKKSEREEPLRDDLMVARDNYEAYRFSRDNGHLDYMRQARKCENFYLGGGRQWSTEDRDAVENEGKPALEINTILPLMNFIIGVQINNRLDISFKPKRNVSDQKTADTLSKTALHVLDQNQFHWRETNVFTDGLVQQRGYYDIRMKFDDNLNGEIDIDILDPLDVMPDPYAQSYDPRDWNQVIVSRWYTYDEIEDMYGVDKAKEARLRGYGETDAIVEQMRPSFANSGQVHTEGGYDSEGNRSIYSFTTSGFPFDPDISDSGIGRMRVIDRQYRRRVMTKFFVAPGAGDMRMVPDTWDDTRVAKFADAMGLLSMKKVVPRVRWTVTAGDVVLHDDWSPYEDFTVVPYFPYFRRGQTIGAIDNLISPQEQLNKMASQVLHMANTTANSGWYVEEDSLGGGMTVEDLETHGAKSGLVIQYRRGATMPQKIQPNRVPPALDRIVQRAYSDIQAISGIAPPMQGIEGDRASGYALELKQAGGMMQLGPPLDNLSRTRWMVARKVLQLIQQYYTAPQVLLITGIDAETGEEQLEELPINQPTIEGDILNDLTIGEYTVVVQSVPNRTTFDNDQLKQMIEMRNANIYIPDDEIILRTGMSNRVELAKRVRQKLEPQTPPEVQQLQQQQMHGEVNKLMAEVGEIQAKTKKIMAEASRASATTTNNSIDAAISLAMMKPGMAKIADRVRSANISPRIQ